jgi:hypothetical protein
MFKVSTPAEFANLKRALATCIFEAQNKILSSKAEDFDEEYLAQQFCGDINHDIDMEELEKQYEDFDFKPMKDAPKV